MAVPNLKIRRYRPADKEAVWELHRLALEPTGAMLSDGKWNDDFNDIENHYLNNGGEFIVGTIDNRIVCMGALRKKSETMAEIKRMRIHPDYQRKGLGQLILDRLEERARQLGYTELCLDTTTKQVPAQKLYEKNGYIEVNRDLFMGFEVNRDLFMGFEVICYEKKIK